uniref:Matrin-type domain-containing protein n=1 Tax=Rhodnius prolixus TaxID=13249 RepID=T1IB00_RHOPR
MDASCYYYCYDPNSIYSFPTQVPSIVTYQNPNDGQLDAYSFYASSNFDNNQTDEDEAFRDPDTIPLPKDLTDLFKPLECELCGVQVTSETSAFTHYEELTSKVVYQQHFSGKQHQKNLRKIQYKLPTAMAEDIFTEGALASIKDLPPPPLPPVLSDFVGEWPEASESKGYTASAAPFVENPEMDYPLQFNDFQETFPAGSIEARIGSNDSLSAPTVAPGESDALPSSLEPKTIELPVELDIKGGKVLSSTAIFLQQLSVISQSANNKEDVTNSGLNLNNSESDSTGEKESAELYTKTTVESSSIDDSEPNANQMSNNLTNQSDVVKNSENPINDSVSNVGPSQNLEKESKCVDETANPDNNKDKKDSQLDQEITKKYHKNQNGKYFYRGHYNERNDKYDTKSNRNHEKRKRDNRYISDEERSHSYKSRRKSYKDDKYKDKKHRSRSRSRKRIRGSRSRKYRSSSSSYSDRSQTDRSDRDQSKKNKSIKKSEEKRTDKRTNNVKSGEYRRDRKRRSIESTSRSSSGSSWKSNDCHDYKLDKDGWCEKQHKCQNAYNKCPYKHKEPFKIKTGKIKSTEVELKQETSRNSWNQEAPKTEINTEVISVTQIKVERDDRVSGTKVTVDPALSVYITSTGTYYCKYCVVSSRSSELFREHLQTPKHALLTKFKTK